MAEHPGVLELAHVSPLRHVLDRAGLRHRDPVLVGALPGTWLAPNRVAVALFA